MEEKQIRLYGNMVYGVKVSNYGLENGYLDYETLSKIVGDCILNNTLHEETIYDWDIMTGDFDEDDEVYQEYIISERGYEFLAECTDEIVFYNKKLDIYLWAVTHFGTAWDYVLTNIKLVDEVTSNV